MAKLSLTQKPTFTRDVMIPVPGEQAVAVKFTFKAKTKDEFKEFVERLRSQSTDDLDIILEVASGWDLEDPFDRDNVKKLEQNYLGSAQAILSAFNAELSGARLGN